MLGDILTCLLVTFRLFLVLVFIINVFAWMIFGDEDEEDADLPVQRDPGGQASGQASGAVACRAPVCIFASPLIPAGGRGPPPNPQDDGSAPPASASEVKVLLSDVVKKLVASLDDDERRPTGAAISGREFDVASTDEQPSYQSVPSAISRQQERDDDVDETEVSLNEWATTIVDDAAADAIQTSHLMAAAVSANGAENETSKQSSRAPEPIARRPASHW